MSDSLRIEGLTVDCVVGVYPHERYATQPLSVDVLLRLDTRAAAVQERVRATVDYAATASQLVFLLRTCRFRLLETAAHVLAKYLLMPPTAGEHRAQVDSVVVRLTKPGALRGFAVPSLEIERAAGEFELVRRERPWGSLDVVHETDKMGIYRLDVAPGATIPQHTHEVMREVEMVLTGGLECQGAPASQGAVHRWPRGARHGYVNPTRSHQAILRVDSPPLGDADEVPAGGAPADVPPEPPWGPVMPLGG